MAVYINLNKTSFQKKWRDDGERLELESRLNDQQFDWIQKRNIREELGVEEPIRPQLNPDEDLRDQAGQMSKAISYLKSITDQRSALRIAALLKINDEIVLYNRNHKAFNAFISEGEVDVNNFISLWHQYKRAVATKSGEFGLFDKDVKMLGNQLIKVVKEQLADNPVQRERLITLIENAVIQRDFIQLNEYSKAWGGSRESSRRAPPISRVVTPPSSQKSEESPKVLRERTSGDDLVDELKQALARRGGPRGGTGRKPTPRELRMMNRR